MATIPSFKGRCCSGTKPRPEQSTITTGTSALVSTNKTANFSLSQNFLTGTSATLSYSNLNQDQNALRNLVNPVHHIQPGSDHNPAPVARAGAGDEQPSHPHRQKQPENQRLGV